MELIKNNAAMVDTSGETSFKAQLKYAEGEVAKLEKECKGVVADASNKEAYKSCKATANKLSKLATQLEKARKEIKAPVLKAGQLIDDGINPLTERMKALAAPFKSAVKEVDDRIKKQEAERQAKVDRVFESFDKAIINAAGKPFSEIEAMVNELADTEIDSKVFGKQTDEATNKLSSTLEKLSSMAVTQKQVEESLQREADLRRQLEEAKSQASANQPSYMNEPPTRQTKSVAPVTTFQPMEVKAKAHSLYELKDLSNLFGPEQLEQLLSDGKNQYPIEVHLVRALPEPKAA